MTIPDNLRAALRWSTQQAATTQTAIQLAGSLWRFWETRGHWTEGRTWLEAALALEGASAAPSTQRSRALTGAGNLASDQGDYARAAALHEHSLSLRRAAGDAPGIASSLSNLGNVVLAQGDYARAAALYEESLALEREREDTKGIAYALNNLGEVARARGDDARAAPLYEESLALLRAVGDTWGIAYSLSALGSVAERQGDDARARALHKESLGLFRRLGDKSGIAETLEGFARLAGTQGRHGHSLQLWGAADALRREIGAPRDLAGQAGYERAMAAARAAIGPVACATALEAGSVLRLEQAIHAALSVWPLDEELRAAPGADGDTAPQPRAIPGRNGYRSARLSAREREIAALVAAGQTNRQIAAATGLAQRTVDTHVGKILGKLGVSTRAAVVAALGDQRGAHDAQPSDATP